MKPITEAVEVTLNGNASMEMLLRARPDAEELLKQAFRVGFADGAFWQSIQVANIYANTKIAEAKADPYKDRQDLDMDCAGKQARAGA